MTGSIASDVIGTIGGLAGTIGAIVAYKSWQLSKKIVRRDLALEVRELSETLHDSIEDVRRIHQECLDRMKSALSAHGLFHSGAQQKQEEAWASDNAKLESAIAKLDAEGAIYNELGDSQLEEKLLTLKSVQRAFDYEKSVAHEWQESWEKLYQRSRDARKVQ